MSDNYGKGVDAIFKGHDIIDAPFPRAGRSKTHMDYDPEPVARAISSGSLVEVDPRSLHVTQPKVTRAGVDHYAEGREGNFADGHKYGNEHPVVYNRTNGDRTTSMLLSGTHRATAALAQGRPLKALVAEGGYGPERKR